MNRSVPDAVPWYREPFVWMLITFPALSVVGGVVMITLALASEDGLVVDDYYRHGKQINRVLARDAAAREMALQAEFVIGDDRSFVLRLRSKQALVQDEVLNLRFSFATRAGFDRDLQLRRTATGTFEGELPALHEGRWYLQIDTPRWRLRDAVRWPLPAKYTLSARKGDV